MADILAYVGTYSNDPQVGIRRLRLDLDTGRLEAAGATAPVDNPFFLVVDAARHRLFATTGPDETHAGPDGGIVSFAIDPASGDLTRLSQQPSRGAMPCYLAVDRGGRNVLVANYTSGSVAVLPVDGTGRLGAATGAVQHHGSSVDPGRQEGPHVHSIVLDPAERFAFAADLGTDQIVAYRFDATAGSLAAADPPGPRVQAGAGPRHLAFHPNGRFAYLVNELDNTAVVFGYDPARGVLDLVQTISMLPAGHEGTSYGADLEILPSGDFLYASNREHNSIVAYAIEPGSGRLRLVDHQESPAWPWNLAVAPGSRFLLAACQQADCVAAFRIDPQTGRLTPTGQQVEVPKAVCVQFGPS
jgi:6-phosphogluconolactonase